MDFIIKLKLYNLAYIYNVKFQISVKKFVFNILYMIKIHS